MIEFVDLSQAQELDAFVSAHPMCHFMQTSLWGRVKHDWKWYGILCRDAVGQIRGSLALLHHKLRFGKSGMFYAPRGPIWDREDQRTFTELIAAAKWLAKQQGAYLLRMDPEIPEEDAEFLQQCRNAGFSCNQAKDFSLFQPRLCYCMQLQHKSAEQLLAEYHRSARYKVHLAIRRGVTVRMGSAEDIPAFYSMMQQTAEKNGFQPRQLEYYASFLSALGVHARLYIAEEDGTTLAAAIAVFYGKKAWFMYGCSDPQALRDHPNELLQWHMQKDALALGCTEYDLRGVEGEPEPNQLKYGLHQYKQGFGAEFRAYVGQLDFVLRPWLNRAVQLAVRLSE